MNNQAIQDTTQGKYFHIMLNMDDDELNPYQYRLLGHYRRVCGQGGQCWESVRTTADKTKMSAATVSRARRELVELGFITEGSTDFGTTILVQIVDRMQENVARYCFSQKQAVSTGNKSVSDRKQRITKEEKRSEESLQTANAVGNVTGFPLRERALQLLAAGENTKQATPLKERERDLIFESVLQYGYGIVYVQGMVVPKQTASRVRGVVKELKAGNVDPQKFVTFCEGYIFWAKGLSFPRDAAKLLASYNQWQSERAAQSNNEGGAPAWMKPSEDYA
jgi:hypothetical protein